MTSRTVITGGLVFDGTGSPALPGEIVFEGNRILEVRTGHHPELHDGTAIVDATGHTVMPGMVESHAHLTFPSAVGHIDPSFNPPLDVSFFHHVEGFEPELARAERNARILLDHGFTSAYSAGSILPMPTEVALRERIDAGVVPGPRFRAAAGERDNLPVDPMGRQRSDWHGPEACDRWVREHAAMGFDSVKFLVSNDDVFVPGGSHMTQYSQEELDAAGRAAREVGVWLNGHCQSPESVKIAVRAGFRSIYHCTYADEEALDLLEAHKDELFVSPAAGIIYANVHEGEEFGITRAVAESMGSVAALEGMQAIYPEIRKRGIKALIGGDYGFPNNPTGRDARDLRLFVDLFGYTPIEALVAATRYGGQVMGMGHELGLLRAGYLADLLVVKGDPTSDVTVLEDADNLTVIVKDGAFHKGAPPA
jgi:imidazolonepropionase-like amidohydrolase